MQNYKLPRRLEDQIVVQAVGVETLIYDERRHQAFCLDPLSSAVWRLSDGAHAVEQMSAALTLELQRPIRQEMVLLALEDLRHRDLLEPETAPELPDGVSRRDLLRRLGTGAALMVPAIACISAPRAAQAYNGCVDCSAMPSRGAVAAAGATARQRDAQKSRASRTDDDQ